MDGSAVLPSEAEAAMRATREPGDRNVAPDEPAE
jgi:hypothetical protein